MKNITLKDKEQPFFELSFYSDLKEHSKSLLLDKMTIIALKKGSIKIEKNFSDFLLVDDALGVLNPFERYKIIPIDNSAKDIHIMQINNDYLKELQKELFGVNDYAPLKNSIIKDIELKEEFLKLCNDIFFDCLMVAKEQRIVEFISKMMIGYIDTETNIKSSDILPCDIRRYIDKHLYSNITLENISKEFLISPSYAIRTFKKEIGVTPHQYIIIQRVNKAKELLKKDSNISRVATYVGFLDQSHLYKYFKSIFGITPKEYIDSLCDKSYK